MNTVGVDMGQQNDGQEQFLVLGGGCFWCLDAAFRSLSPVRSVQCGYAAGTIPFPSYEQVCTGQTGHAEVVRVGWDPDQWGIEDVLEVFFKIHDPTTLNRQGHDVGTQYRSLIVLEDACALGAVQAILERQQLNWSRPIVTEILVGMPFYPAEVEHQDYFRHHPNQGYCRVVIAPKVNALKEQYASLWHSQT